MSKRGADNRTLPNREAVTFRSIVRYYEQKQYKKAIKAADQVLKRFPSHGETLAMRGLTLKALDKREEAYDHVKRGLRNDLKSHVCWHVYGLLYRSDRDYGEAIKCYVNALKWDPDNLQILRDLSLLQVQLQNYDGFIETRRKILSLKSNNKMHWISYAVGNLLGGRYDTAVRVVTSYLGTETEVNSDPQANFERSELVLFRNQAIYEGGNIENALLDLDEIRPKVVDNRTFLSQKAKYLLKLKRFQEAVHVYHDLLDANIDNYEYHRGLQAALLQLDAPKLDFVLNEMKHTALPSSEMVLSDGDCSILAQAYEDLQQKFPKSGAVNRIPLQFLNKDEAFPKLKAYIKHALKKGKPNLGSDLLTMLRLPNPSRLGFLCHVKDPFDVQNLEMFQFFLSTIDEIVESLKENSTLPDCEDEENPSVLLFSMYLKVQLLEAANRLEDAFALIDECIEHTPTAIDLYVRKGRILKKMGLLQEAADVMDFARRIDLADRYINNKATKYLLRADRVEEAEATIALFTRHEGDPQFNLYEMQCSWYELEWAESHFRRQKYGLALKKFFAVDKHFEDFMEDQFDFHTYCVRKGTLRAYVDLLRMASKVQSHFFFQRAAKGIINTYLRLYDDPTLVIPVQGNGKAEEVENSQNSDSKPPEVLEPAPQLTAAQRKKKAKQKAKKAAKRERKEREAKEAKEKEEEEKDDNRNNGRRRRVAPPDDDPYGNKFLERDPLEEAKKFSSLLNLYASDNIDTHILSYDVSVRRGKVLIALRALVRGFALAPRDPELFLRIVDFEEGILSDKFVLDETQTGIVDIMTARWRKGDLSAFVSEYCDFACGLMGTLRMRVVAAIALAKLDQSRKEEAVAMIRSGFRGRGASVKECRYAIETLKQISGVDLSDVLIEMRELYPRADI